MKPITLTLQASLKLTILLAAAWLFFNAMLFITPLSLAWQCVICLLSLIMTIYSILRDALLKLPWSVKEIRLNKAGEWHLIQKNNREITVKLSADSYVSESLIILQLSPLEIYGFRFGFCRYVVLLNVSVQVELLRQLRVNLLWGTKKEKPRTISV